LDADKIDKTIPIQFAEKTLGFFSNGQNKIPLMHPT
jgi:hypothetical protein